MGAPLRITGLSKSFGATSVLRNINLDIEAGNFVSLLGPSGCGKSTLLRIVAGFTAQNEGTISLGGQAIDHVPPSQRNLAMVFQNYALYPHMSVSDNISMALEIKRLGTVHRLPVIGRLLPEQRRRMSAIRTAVQQVADVVEISHLLRRRPAELSGGQRQRVALARAIVRAPDLFLMDEPLSNLDARLRVSMRAELVALNKRLGATMLYVTHDQQEAMAMSDRIALMMGGRILQYGTPDDIYNAPLNLDVAKFVGQPSINCLSADCDPNFSVPEAETANLKPDVRGRELTLAIRPESFILQSAPASQAALNIAVMLERVELLGPEVLLWTVAKRTGRRLVAQVRASDYRGLVEAGGLVGNLWLTAPAAALHIFASSGEAVRFHRSRPNEARSALAVVQ